MREIFNAEYEFECHYDNTSKWEQRWEYEYYAYYSFDGTGLDGNGYFIDISHPDAMPYEVHNFASGNRLYYNYNNGEILNFNNNFSATGWYFRISIMIFLILPETFMAVGLETVKLVITAYLTVMDTLPHHSIM